MKYKLFILVLALSLMLCSFLTSLADDVISVGVLSYLNLSEEGSLLKY